jgi:hypothetical protein
VKGKLVKLLTDTIHVIYGFITSYTSFFNPLLSILFFISYFAYQLVDYLGEPDVNEMKEDIVEYTIGLVVGLVVLII